VLQSCPNGHISSKKKYLNKVHHFLYCNSYSYRFLLTKKITNVVLNIIFPDEVPPHFFSATRKSAEEYFLDIQNTSKQYNSTLIILPFCQENVSLSNFFHEKNITYYPILCEPSWHFLHDGHWNPSGHKNVSGKLYDYLKENKFI
jgi:hypothetical protein